MHEFLDDKEVLKTLLKINKDEQLNDNDFLIIINKYINVFGLSDYVKRIIKKDRFKFEYENYAIDINNPMDSKSENMFTRLKKELKNGKQLNVSLLFFIFHELEHVNQFKKIIKYPEKENPEVLKSMMYTLKYPISQFGYNRKMIEYNANINALNKINEISNIIKFDEIEFLNKYVTNKFIYEPYMDTINDYIPILEYNLKGLKNNFWLEYMDSPLEGNYDIKPFIKAYKCANKKPKHVKYDLRSRLLRGDILTPLELETLKRIANGEIKTNDVFNTLEQLNEKVKGKDNETGLIGRLFR